MHSFTYTHTYRACQREQPCGDTRDCKFSHLRTFLFFPPPVAGDRRGWCDLFQSFTSNNKRDVLCFVSAGGRDAAARDEVNV